MSWSILGHDWVISLLKNHIRSGNTRHAYLFSGIPGIGKRTLAIQFSQALNCLEPPEVGEFCGECRNCRRIANLQHPDFIIGQSEEPGAILKIEPVREIQKTLSLSPYEAPWRIALLLRFDEANANAQNALLKTLEEPAERVKLLLTASSDNAVLPTIASRCEIIRMRPSDIATASKLLRKKLSLTEDAALRLAHLSAGRIGSAIQFNEMPETVDAILRHAREGLEMFASNIRQRFQYAVAFRDFRKRGELRALMLEWQALFRDLMLLRADPDARNSLTYIDLVEEMGTVSQKAEEHDFPALLQNTRRALDYLDANVSPQLVLENLLLAMPRIR